MTEIQVLGKQIASPVNGQIKTGANESILIRGGVTDTTQVGDFDVWTEWDGELFNGTGVLPDAASGYEGPFELTSGHLYVRSVSQQELSTAPALISSVPVVVKVGTAAAGSVGTHWLVLCVDQAGPPVIHATWIVLIKHPTDPLGRVEIQDDSGDTAYLSLESHYIKLPNHSLSTIPAQRQQRHISTSKDPQLVGWVQAAIDRAVWQTP